MSKMIMPLQSSKNDFASGSLKPG